jgi:zinc finger CCHC domain-containing protein 9
MTRYTKYCKKQYNDPTASSGFRTQQRSYEPERGIQKIKSACFKCRKEGHLSKNCPMAGTTNELKCYTCGDSGHTSKSCTKPITENDAKSKYKFAVCYVCNESGHIASECAQNPNGLYPNGGGCRHCASNKHLAKDCPKTNTARKQPGGVVVGLEDANSILPDVDEGHIALRAIKEAKNSAKPQASKPKGKIVKFQ